MKRRYKLENLGCASCAAKIEHAISNLDGVKDVSVNFMMQSFTLDAEDSKFKDIVDESKKIMDKIESGTIIV